MAADLSDMFALQLAQQASLYNLTYKAGRRQSAERVAAFFHHMLRLLGVTHTLEVGAHEAGFSRKAKAEHGDLLTARAYEANPLVHAHFLLDDEMRSSGVEYNFMAIGNFNGSIKFHIYASTMGKAEPAASRRHSCLLRTDSPDDPHYAVTVPIQRLDSLCAADPSDSLYAMWIDAEGFGREVLSGAGELLDRTAAIYIEVESAPHFQKQAMDRQIMAMLLEKDFLPVLRDFLFPHQYNIIFVKKAFLPFMEQEWHRYFQGVLRKELQNSFNLEAIPQKNVRQPPPRLAPRLLTGVAELRELMEALPVLRGSRSGLDPAKAVVACHYPELAMAVEYYRAACGRLPEFYVLDKPEDLVSFNGLRIHDFASLNASMDIQMFFVQARLPGATPFAHIALSLQRQGIEKYHIESWSTEKFYLRNAHARFSEADWDTILNFYNLLADDKSRYTYLAICMARLRAEPGYIPLAGYAQYQHPLAMACAGDTICEGGCCTVVEPGMAPTSSTQNFYNQLDGKGQIWGFEPFPQTLRQLEKEFAQWPGIHMVGAALWSGTGKLEIVGEGSSAYTRFSEKGDCECVSVDSFFAQKEKPTLIKLDVEGAELEVLKGAAASISETMPKLMVSIYHSRPASDWISIPRYLLECGLSYDYFCGHHRPWYNESVLYARQRNQ